MSAPDIVQCPDCKGLGGFALGIDRRCGECDGKGYIELVRWPNWETALFFAFGIFVGVALALQV